MSNPHDPRGGGPPAPGPGPQAAPAAAGPPPYGPPGSAPPPGAGPWGPPGYAAQPGHAGHPGHAAPPGYAGHAAPPGYAGQPGHAPPGYAAYPGGPPGYPGAAQAAAAPPRRTHLVAAVRPPSGHGFGAMAALSMRRAFRLGIDANEVLDDERAAMLAARPAVTDATQQAFLAWRRSVLFMAALLMVPVALLHAIEQLNFADNVPEDWKALAGLQVLVEIAFSLFLWTQVPRWTRWKRQSRALTWAWLVYFLTPFLVFLYPMATSYDAQLASAGSPEMAQGARMLVGISIGAQALVSLAPKIIALLQGGIRASIATKTLFPGASAPGWLMVLAAPLYMIVFYVFVLLPYHFTDSGLVVLGMLLVLSAKGTLVRAGLRLTRPMLPDAARLATRRALSLWLTLLATGAGFIFAGLWNLVSQASGLTVINFGLSMASNILLLTLIGTDGLIAGLDRARGTSAEERKLADEVHGQLAAFTAAGMHDDVPPPPMAPPPMAPPPMAPPR